MRSVYVAGGKNSGIIKIGMSGDVQKRVPALKKKYMVSGTLVFNTEPVQSAGILERQCHAVLSKYSRAMSSSTSVPLLVIRCVLYAILLSFIFYIQ